MLNREGEVNHNNPIYNAGFIEGRKFERELIEERNKQRIGPKGEPGFLSVQLSLSDMDIFKELAQITKSLADFIECSYIEGDKGEEAAKLIQSLNDFLNRYDEKTEEKRKDLESVGVKFLRQ